MLAIYLLGVVISNRSYKKWPLYRTVFMIAGVICCLTAISRPVAGRSHADFIGHMMVHLLLGMLAPLLMVFAAPITLVLRALPINYARKGSKVLKSKFFRFIGDPLTASVLNIGGLWLLYTTDLFAKMQQNGMVHLFVHSHVFLAGFVFTAAYISDDPPSHRTSFVYRGIVLVIALASHSILSKYIYAHPPDGVPDRQAQIGGMLMYYGGDLIDLVIIFVLCYKWYKAYRPRPNMQQRVYDIK